MRCLHHHPKRHVQSCSQHNFFQIYDFKFSTLARVRNRDSLRLCLACCPAHSGSLWPSLALSGSLWLSVRLTLARRPALSGPLWLPLALSGSLWLSIALRISSHGPRSAGNVDPEFQHFNQLGYTLLHV